MNGRLMDPDIYRGTRMNPPTMSAPLNPLTLTLWNAGTIPAIDGYKQLTPRIPGLDSVIPSFEELSCFHTEWMFVSCNKDDSDTEDSAGPGIYTITVTNGSKQKTIESYCKVTHALDPVRWMQGFYKDSEKGARRVERKAGNPDNQAYVDAFACILFDRVRSEGLSPHFCLTYGAYKGVADIHRWNITDEYDSYRKYRKFWEKRREGNFTLYLEREPYEEDQAEQSEDEDQEDQDDDDDDDDDDDEEQNEEESDGSWDEESITTECRKWFTNTPTSDLHSRAFSYRTDESFDTSDDEEDDSAVKQERSQVILQEHTCELTPCPICSVSAEPLGEELESIQAMDLVGAELESVSIEEWKDDEEETLETVDDSIQIYSEMKDFPVMIIYQEKMDGTFDSLLESLDPDSMSKEEYERQVSAWIFQIIAAISQMQGLFNMTHNDLHTNNIVYTTTKEKYLWYRSKDGRIWKVPTYGILLRIIDFGRSIYTYGGRTFMSDDFARGGDAEGQYSEGVSPNKSFDLCRFSVSAIETLFPEVPDDLPNGRSMSKDGEWEQKETVSPLYNMLWSWLIKDDGTNVLKTKDGSEKYPDFELYIQITEHVHGAIPSDQFGRNGFDEFRMERMPVSSNTPVYSLFD
jgi:hypothetical protein